MNMKHSGTEQEEFWKGEFGDAYIQRNVDPKILAANIMMFSRILRCTNKVYSVMEFGANIGLNMRAIRTLLPHVGLAAVELNKKAYDELRKIEGIKAYNQSILDFKSAEKSDFVLVKGVLIHINPEMLPIVYDLLYNTSRKYLCIAEYYNPTPVTIDYHGHKNVLFKRDFAGEMLDRFADLKLVNYGFTYHRDNYNKFGDVNWFLLEK
jgi:pseudaminic acid biosynthesis-associated methylase